jgi:hypothetical protein
MKRFTLVLCSLVFSAACAAAWETSSFRASNGGLVRLGMTKAEVRRDAGAPLDRAKGAKTKNESSKRPGDVWTYRGNDGVYSIKFSGGRVEKITVAPHRGR